MDFPFVIHGKRQTHWLWTRFRDCSQYCVPLNSFQEAHGLRRNSLSFDPWRRGNPTNPFVYLIPNMTWASRHLRNPRRLKAETSFHVTGVCVYIYTGQNPKWVCTICLASSIVFCTLEYLIAVDIGRE